MFAIEVLGYLEEMFSSAGLKDDSIVSKAKELREQVEQGLKEQGIIEHPKFGKIIAFEVNGYGSFHMMDDANVPSIVIITLFRSHCP